MSEPSLWRTVLLPEEEIAMAEKRPEAPHTVPAGIMDDWLGNKGPNGELMHRGEPALVVDVPDDEDEDED